MTNDVNSPKENEVIPPEVYFSRRMFLKAGVIAASLGATAAIYRRLNGVETVTAKPPQLAGLKPATAGAGYPPTIA